MSSAMRQFTVYLATLTGYFRFLVLFALEHRKFPFRKDNKCFEINLSQISCQKLALTLHKSAKINL